MSSIIFALIFLMFCDIIIYTLGQKGGDNMKLIRIDGDNRASKDAARVNPSFGAELRKELQAIEEDPCNKCRRQSCIGCSKR